MASRSDTVRHSGPEALRPLILPPPFRDPLPSPQLGGFWVFLHPWRRLWHPDQERPPSRASPLERHKRSVRPSLPMGRNRHQAPGGLKHNDRLPSGPHGHKVPGGQHFDSSSSKRLPMEPPPQLQRTRGCHGEAPRYHLASACSPFLSPWRPPPALSWSSPCCAPTPGPLVRGGCLSASLSASWSVSSLGKRWAGLKSPPSPLPEKSPSCKERGSAAAAVPLPWHFPSPCPAGVNAPSSRVIGSQSGPVFFMAPRA